MATLKTNTLTGTSTAGSIAVTGEGNSTTTNLQQGLAKSWCDYNGSGTPALTDSFNIGGITDNGTGDYTFAYTNAMASANYVWSGCVQYEGGSVNAVLWLAPKSGASSNRGASSVRVASVYDSDGSITVYDYEQQQFLVQGDLA